MITVLVGLWFIVSGKIDDLKLEHQNLSEFKKEVAAGEQKSEFVGIVKSSSAINHHTRRGGLSSGLLIEMDSGDFVGINTNMVSVVKPGVEVRSASHKGESFYCLIGSVADCFPSLNAVAFGP